MSDVEILVEIGDLLAQDVDLIVNPANGSLNHAGGLARKIAEAAGPSLLDECERLPLVPTGGAVATHAGELNFMAVVHAVGPVWGGGQFCEAELLRGAHVSACKVAGHFASAYGRDVSIAFPAISCGIYGYPVKQAAPIAVASLRGKHVDGIGVVKFVLFEDEHFEAYTKALAAQRPRA
ncbi:MAG: macro domain-containing protein [Baekduia sp.]